MLVVLIRVIEISNLVNANGSGAYVMLYGSAFVLYEFMHFMTLTDVCPFSLNIPISSCYYSLLFGTI